jgi:putative acetyltransferase
MRGAIRAITPGVHRAAELAAWASLPPLYHRWAMGPGGETYLVAERRGRIVGYAALRGHELAAVFVTPRAQGRGVGRALVAHAVRAARRSGAAELVVVAALSAIGFYRTLGFAPSKAVRVPLPERRWLASMRMRLRLPA